MTNDIKPSICFFEDHQSVRFQPLTLTRPADNLRVGALTIAEKWKADLESETFLRKTEPHLRAIFQTDYSFTEQVFWINSRLLPHPAIVRQVNNLEPGECIQKDDTLFIALVDRTVSQKWLDDGVDTSTLTVRPPDDHPRLLGELWDLLKFNPDEIQQDIRRIPEMHRFHINGNDGVHQYGSHPVYKAPGAVVEPGVTFITTKGPVLIDRNAHIMAGSRIRGPAAIGRRATIKMGTKVYENCTVGPVCKVAGEINNVIFHSYSNKSHDGFTGNSIFGQWCNLGADTNTSNLKNSYGEVKFADWQSGEKRNTGQQFLGTIMGDHSKTGINTMLNTGTNCGVCCNIFDSGFPPTLIRSFSWVGTNGSEVYRFDKAIETMERVMQRRDVELTDEYIEMMRYLFENR